MALLLLTGLLATGALGAVTFQQASTGMTNPTSGNAATSLSIARPPGLVEGEFLLAHITYEKGSDAGTSASYTPAGWTLLNRRNESTDLGQAVFYKFAGASEPTSYSFTFSQAVKAAGAILRYSGVHATNPVVTSSSNSGPSGTLTATGVAVEADSMAVALFGVKKATSLTLPAGYTSRVDYANPQDVKIRTVDRYFPASGTTGNVTSTAGSSDKWVAHLVVLRQADPPPPSNNAPVYMAPADQTADTSVEKAVTLGSFADADTHPTWNVTVNWGDGTTEDTFTVNATGSLGTRNHTYASAGEKTVTVTVSDGTDTDSDTFKVTVATPNQAPTVSSAAEDASADEGDILQTSGSFSDDAGGDDLTIVRQSGAGTVTDNGNGTWSWSLATTDNGGGTVVVRGTDSQGLYVEDTFDWSAANVAPTATFNVPSTSVEEGETFQLSLTNPVDPSSADVTAGFTYRFDCGSGYGSWGSSNQSECTAGAAGPQGVKGAIRDKDNGATEYTGTVTVTQATATPECTTYSAAFHQPLLGNDVANTFKNGRVVPVKVSLTDSCGAPLTGSSGQTVTIRVVKVNGSTAGGSDPVEEFADAGQSSSNTNAFRWSGDQWIYNLDSKALRLVSGTHYHAAVQVNGTTADEVRLAPTK